MLTMLDLFCGAGGAASGYQHAGFYVVGVDHLHQPNYCGEEFVQMDVFDYLAEEDMSRFDAIHASPPCQAYSLASNMPNARDDHPRLIEPVRDALIATGLPYIIENVVGAPMINPVKLCGTSFGLGVDYDGPSGEPGRYELRRHRLFETNMDLKGIPCRPHRKPTIGIYGHHCSYERRRHGPGKGQFSRTERVALAQEAMGIDWADEWPELKEAIPPAFSEFLGRQLRKKIEALQVARTIEKPLPEDQQGLF